MSTARMLSPVWRLVLLTGLLVGLGACGAASSTPSPTVRPSLGPVTTPEDAVGRVVVQEPRLAGVPAFDTGLVGQASWYTVEPASGVGAFIVTMRIGWGDCEAGCIGEHRWTYAVAPDGTVTTLSESGGPVPSDAWPTAPASGWTGISGSAVAGPVCPAEREPPDPACAPRPVAGATVVIRNAEGSEVARSLTLEDGTFFVELPAGAYEVELGPVEGLMGTAPAQSVTVIDGATTRVQFDYDTGIR